MLREGIARARAILQERKPDTAGRGGRGKRRREESEAKRLSGLDLGEGSRFAALAKKCLDLEEGVSVDVGNGRMEKYSGSAGTVELVVMDTGMTKRFSGVRGVARHTALQREHSFHIVGIEVRQDKRGASGFSSRAGRRVPSPGGGRETAVHHGDPVDGSTAMLEKRNVVYIPAMMRSTAVLPSISAWARKYR